MRLLFDGMLSHTLPRLLADLYPGSTHIRDLGMSTSPDTAVWQYARDFDFIVTSEDTDHVELNKRWGFPPKLILVQVGNAATWVVAEKLRRQHRNIRAFSDDPDRGIYELH